MAAEMCTLFSIAAQIPLKYIVSRSYTSELVLVNKMMQYFKKGDLLLLDNGFYKMEIFTALRKRCCQFIIPAATSYKPRLLQKISRDDFIAEVRSSTTGKTIKVRVVYVYRKGFRRRRLFTSLLDSKKYTTKEIATLYHYRWMIETFFREFKSGMESLKWHCRTVHSFKIELCSHMIVITLIRMIMQKAAENLKKKVWEISFAKSLIEVRLFFKRLFSQGRKTFSEIFQSVLDECAKYLVDIRRGRFFPRSKNEYRSIARGKNKRRGRKPAKIKPNDERQKECLIPSKGGLYLLS